MLDTKMETVLADIQAILIEHDLAGVVFLADNEHVVRAKMLQAEWNALFDTYEDDEAVLPNGCDFDMTGHTTEGETTLNMIASMIEAMEGDAEEMRGIYNILIDTWERAANNN